MCNHRGLYFVCSFEGHNNGWRTAVCCSKAREVEQMLVTAGLTVEELEKHTPAQDNSQEATAPLRHCHPKSPIRT